MAQFERRPWVTAFELIDKPALPDGSLHAQQLLAEGYGGTLLAESVRLSGLGWVELLRELARDEEAPRDASPTAATLPARHCPVCRAALKAVHNRSRWGSCSSDGRLSFTWHLALTPAVVVDYLAAHEVAHLQEMNHSARFWKLCRELTAGDMDEARAWLKAHGGRTLAFGL